MKSNRVIDFVAFAERAYKEGWGYVWGASGEVYTMDVAKNLLKSYATGQYNSTYYLSTQLKRWGGKRVVDCSGLIQAFRGQDDTANGLMQKCKVKGVLSDFSGNMGQLVFCAKTGHADHVGIVVENGYVIHSTSSVKGVIKERLATSTRGFTHYGIPDWIDFSFDTPKKTITKNSSMNDIAWLQSKLNEALKSKLVVDASYGPRTAKAVMNFQKISDKLQGTEVSLELIKKLSAT